MKRRRWLPFVALAALGPTLLVACIVGITEETFDGGADGSSAGDGPNAMLDASVDGGRGLDAMSEADAPTDSGPVLTCWDGASPSSLVITGMAYPDHIHLEIIDGGGPGFSLKVYDKLPNDAGLGTFAACTTSFDDNGSKHLTWGLDGSTLVNNYEFYYEFTVLLPDGGPDLTWPYRPLIIVQAENDGVQNAEGDAESTCPAAAAKCTEIPMKDD